MSLEGVPVLVVDDNATNRGVLMETLAAWHMKPTLAGDGDAALRCLRDAAATGHAFSLVLLDSQMPDTDGFSLAGQIRRQPELREIRLMMITSAGERGDAARCGEFGIAAYLTKPVVRSELLRAILQVLGSNPTEKNGATLMTRHSLRTERCAGHILLAEDNPVNQALAVQLLTKQGYQVEVAGDGREALEKFAAGRFDVVLMDIQMPEMDGLQATAAIREIERTKGGHAHIVAMTAHAMKGDRERCLKAGMDSYVTKPIRAPELFRAIERAANSAPLPA